MLAYRSIVLAGLGLIMAAPAHAQPGSTQAEALFQDGRTLMAAGQTAEACAAFDHSQLLDPRVTTLLHVAACREKTGQLVAAWRTLREAEQLTRREDDVPTEQLHRLALERIARLEPRLPTLTIVVRAEDKQLEHLEILRDRDPVPAVLWNGPLRVDPGTYTITARAPGVEWETQVTLEEGKEATVNVPDLRGLKPTSGLIASRGDDQPARLADRPERHAGRLPLGLAAGSVVLASASVGLAAWGVSTFGNANDAPENHARYDTLTRSANRKLYLAEGFAIAGLGCAGAAVLLYLREQSTPEKRPPRDVARGGLDRRSPQHEQGNVVRTMLVPSASGITAVGWF